MSEKVVVLDLDHTILHMLKKSDMPSNDAGFAEDVVFFAHMGVDYAVAVRVGTTSLVRAVKAAGVGVAVVTCNLVADKVMAAIAARCAVFDKIPVHVVESREKGAKSLASVGIAARQVVIVDDSLSAWDPVDQELVVEARRFDVLELALLADRDDDEADAKLDAELGYLTQTRDDLLAIFTPPAIDWTSAAPAPASRDDALPPPSSAAAAAAAATSPLVNQASLAQPDGSQSAPIAAAGARLAAPASRKRAAETAPLHTTSAGFSDPVALAAAENLPASRGQPPHKKILPDHAVVRSAPVST
mmetsp:Transcript_13244/g.41887  ORF Transcript_13244/g.41887 Transcript_13244/m.41887 type:complete len:302 (+) Transcript_13244:130-1035(+)